MRARWLGAQRSKSLRGCPLAPMHRACLALTRTSPNGQLLSSLTLSIRGAPASAAPRPPLKSGEQRVAAPRYALSGQAPPGTASSATADRSAWCAPLIYPLRLCVTCCRLLYGVGRPALLTPPWANTAERCAIGVFLLAPSLCHRLDSEVRVRCNTGLSVHFWQAGALRCRESCADREQPRTPSPNSVLTHGVRATQLEGHSSSFSRMGCFWRACLGLTAAFGCPQPCTRSSSCSARPAPRWDDLCARLGGEARRCGSRAPARRRSEGEKSDLTAPGGRRRARLAPPLRPRLAGGRAVSPPRARLGPRWRECERTRPVRCKKRFRFGFGHPLPTSITSPRRPPHVVPPLWGGGRKRRQICLFVGPQYRPRTILHGPCSPAPTSRP